MFASSFNVRRNVLLGGIVCLLLALFESAVAAGAERTLYAFKGGDDGTDPGAALIQGKDGTLYGTTWGGGTGRSCIQSDQGCGTVFKLTPQGRKTVLYDFSGSSDGANPASNLVMDGSGNLYGTTGNGGSGWGTVFKLAPHGRETVLYAFQGPPDGGNPMGNLVADASGNLYGTTVSGGNTGGNECQSGGCGIVFKVAPDGTETVLHAFQGGSDGYLPEGGVILDGSGNLYGTTAGGGGSGCNLGFGCGTVFKVAPDGTETVLYAFQGGNDGAYPWGSPIMDANGNLYGTTLMGGPSDRGTVFKLAPDGTETVLYAFSLGSDGYYPYAGLVADAAGDLFGTTGDGGTGCDGGGCGTVFELTAPGSENVLYAFHGRHGRYPLAGLLLGADNELYGTTSEGGNSNNGVVFALKK